MLTRICDKCGKEVDEYNINELTITPRYTITRHYKSGKTEDVDLCSDCLEEFESWLKIKGSKL